jgi:hypothetical protein
VAGSVAIAASAWTTAAAVPLIAVNAAPLIVPVPPATLIALICDATATPLKTVLKLTGSINVKGLFGFEEEEKEEDKNDKTES